MTRAAQPRSKAATRRDAKPVHPASIQPGPSHKAWFDDYPVKGAGLIQR